MVCCHSCSQHCTDFHHKGFRYLAAAFCGVMSPLRVGCHVAVSSGSTPPSITVASTLRVSAALHHGHPLNTNRPTTVSILWLFGHGRRRPAVVPPLHATEQISHPQPGKGTWVAPGIDQLRHAGHGQRLDAPALGGEFFVARGAARDPESTLVGDGGEAFVALGAAPPPALAPRFDAELVRGARVIGVDVSDPLRRQVRV
jgi:hypothetical protein